MEKQRAKKDSSSLWTSLIAISIIVIIVFGTILISSPKKTKTTTNINQETLIENKPILGNPNASLTIIEFADYECPYCREFYLNTFSQIKSEYINTGKAKYVYINYPLSIHPYAEKAAEAAECAGEQNKYYEMGNLLYTKGVEGGIKEYQTYAKELNLNMSKFNNCLGSNRTKPIIEKDIQEGDKVGVTGTPTFLIDGKKIIGAQPYSIFKQILDKATK